jgi:hypothetical protein
MRVLHILSSHLKRNPANSLPNDQAAFEFVVVANALAAGISDEFKAYLKRTNMMNVIAGAR